MLVFFMTIEIFKILKFKYFVILYQTIFLFIFHFQVVYEYIYIYVLVHTLFQYYYQLSSAAFIIVKNVKTVYVLITIKIFILEYVTEY